MRVAGVMSGTSLDGIDVAIVDFVGDDLHVVGQHAVAYPDDVRRAILAVSNSVTHTGSIARLHFFLAELYADAVRAACERIGAPLVSLDLIGCHGQTIFHEGESIEFLGRRIASTLQIGDAAVIAKRCGVPVIADFRPDDIAVGGQGAPLAPFLDWRLFRHSQFGRIALNIGGIANISVIRAGASLEDVIAFDTGPGNMVIDGLIGGFDRDGAVARRGRVNQPLLERLLSDPYYKRRPPKTAGREQYGAEFLAHFAGLPLADAVATATELTATTIARAIPDASEVIASGGGVHNSYLMERLAAQLTQPLTTSAKYGVDPDFKEAIAFAVLAHESFMGRPGNAPGATGARRAAILGKRASP
jgi:anhydro-N-acetylmuramic acid kinase